MLGNVFSPYYAFARRKTPANPLNHCAINVALYGRSTKHWAMTERTRHDVQRTPTLLEIGPSSVSWDGNSLTFVIDERCVPVPLRCKGKVRVFPSGIANVATQLDPSGLHWWLPLAPTARVQVEFEHPNNTWAGDGYLDCNFGQQPLEDAFKRWNWSRGKTKNDTIIFYDVETRCGAQISLAKIYDQAGHPRDLPSQDNATLPNTLWRISRRTNCDKNAKPQIVKTLEDTPFYARSLMQTTIESHRITMMHESLSLERFANPIVRAMLPFRMPRRRFTR
jgi:carotenoid 1,2-hydratase